MTKPLACRACLAVDVKLHDITQTLLAEAFETASGISISNNSNFPPYLCTYCCRKTQNCVGFRKQCLVAQQKIAELCSSGEPLTQGLIKSSDIKGLSRIFTRTITLYIDYNPSASRESSPPVLGDGLDIKTEYPLSNDPLNNVTVTYDPSEDEVNPELATQTGKKDYDYVEVKQLCQSKPQETCKPKPKKNTRKVAKPRKVLKKSATAVAATPNSSVKKETAVKETVIFKCDLCDKQFTVKSRWTMHQRKHTGDRPYQCDVCGKSFICGPELTNHRRIHTGERPFKCNLCDKTYRHHTQIITHRLTHTGERPFKCATCDKAFTARRDLVTHTRIHTGEKPYTCDTCGRSFTTIGNIISHKRVHTGEKPYKCEACGRCFSNSSTCCKHKRMYCPARRV